MKKILIIFGIAAFIIACGSNDESESAGKTDTASSESAAPAIDGKKIYKQYCVTCHGLYGDMGASGAFNLQTSKLALDERVTVITNGRNLMTPFKSLLDPDQIKAVATYTLELKEE
jgi:mono/diheme cytochrome c family protein